MSRLAEFRKLEQQLAAQLAELETLKNDSGLQREIEFETKLRELLQTYGFGLREIVGMLDPHAQNTQTRGAAVPEKKPRKARDLKVYKSPLTGEVVETKGGNHKLLKAWKAQFGDEVENWRVYH
jgi:hypothetical protein